MQSPPSRSHGMVVMVPTLTWAGESFACHSMSLTLQNKCITAGLPKNANNPPRIQGIRGAQQVGHRVRTSEQFGRQLVFAREAVTF